jgi:hypothetical protein
VRIVDNELPPLPHQVKTPSPRGRAESGEWEGWKLPERYAGYRGAVDMVTIC